MYAILISGPSSGRADGLKRRAGPTSGRADGLKRRQGPTGSLDTKVSNIEYSNAFISISIKAYRVFPTEFHTHALYVYLFYRVTETSKRGKLLHET